MAILERFSQIMKSNINAMLDKCEDPAKMIDQVLLDLRRDLAEVKKETANVMGNAKLAAKTVADCQADIVRYGSAAEKALMAGSEADAMTLLAKKQQYEGQLAGLQENQRAADANAAKIRQMHDKLSAEIADLESRKATIKAKLATAKTMDRMNNITAGKRAESSIEAFSRYESQADSRLASAEAMAELNDTSDSADDLAKKYASTPVDASVNAELAAMKAKLGLS